MADLWVEDATTGPSMSESRRATYWEAHSALSWPLLACGLFAAAAAEIACLVLGALVNPDWFVLAGLLPSCRS